MKAKNVELKSMLIVVLILTTILFFIGYVRLSLEKEEMLQRYNEVQEEKQYLLNRNIELEK